MPPSRKEGSLTSEAARLSATLGFLVTVGKIRWWRDKGFDLQDIPGLRKRLLNQESVRQISEGDLRTQDDEEEEEVHDSMAYHILSDEAIAEMPGMISKAVVIEYVRDLLEAFEESPRDLLKGKSDEEFRECRRLGSRINALRFWQLLGGQVS